MRFGKVFISGGFVLCFTLLYLLISFEFVLIILLSVLAHEAGHLIAIRLFGGKVSDVRLECVGILIKYDGTGMSYISELLAALAGPLMSLILAFAAAYAGKKFGTFFYALGGFSLVLCAFNLLPISVLDGGRMLYMTIAQCWDPDMAEKAGVSVSCAFSLLLMILGVWALRVTGWNFTLLLCGIWLFWASAIVKKPVWV